MTNEEMLRSLKTANAAVKKVQEVQSIPDIEPPTVVLPEPPYIETAQFQEELNQIRASLQDISDTLEVEKQARISAEADNEKQKAIETKRAIRDTVLAVIAIIVSTVAAVAAVLALLPPFR